MMRTLLYILCGYLSGSVLYARVWTHLCGKEVALLDSKDGNPGTANAFAYGGVVCGVLTLAGDLLKGLVPVFCFVRWSPVPPQPIELALVLAAPALGHAFSIFYQGQGGKGIAVSFGCLLGLLPQYLPVGVLAACFLLFSLVVKIVPHFYRTAITYLCASLGMLVLTDHSGSTLGFLLMTGIVCLRLHMSKEVREEMKVELPWMF